MKKKPTALVICDGLGYSEKHEYNAVYQAHPPTLTMLLAHYPHALLRASGSSVGLLPAQHGNSLVGHMTMGAGRIIQQPITALSKAIEDGSLCTLPVLKKCFAQLQTTSSTLHIMGLVSDGASHSHIEHLLGLLRCAHKHGVTHIVVHAFLDGRDVAPQSAHTYLQQVQDLLDQLHCGIIGSITGRSYAMDRIHNRTLTQKTFDMLTKITTPAKNISWQDVLKSYYAENITDELIPPTRLKNFVPIAHGDGLIYFNIRADRARDLTELFYKDAALQLSFFITGIQYREDLPTEVLFRYPTIKNTLLDVLSAHQQTIFTIAEKEKYAHVSYFFNGGREVLYPHEERHIIPSLPAEQLRHHPEMSAPEITQYVLNSLAHDPRDFYLINYANADMLGHTGDLPAMIAAISCLDTQLKLLYETIVQKMDGTLYITADHGNAESQYNEATHQINTEHTSNPVPFIMVQKNLQGKNITLPLHQLRDTAPFILKNYGYKIPAEMNDH